MKRCPVRTSWLVGRNLLIAALDIPVATADGTFDRQSRVK